MQGSDNFDVTLVGSWEIVATVNVVNSKNDCKLSFCPLLQDK